MADLWQVLPILYVVGWGGLVVSLAGIYVKMWEQENG